MPSRSRNHRNTFRAKLTARNVFDIRQLADSWPRERGRARAIQAQLGLVHVRTDTIEDVIAGRSFTEEAPTGAEGAYKL